jgi:hypothetical protein
MGSVVSLLIERVDQPSRLLMGVRDPRVNVRHPGVLSTVTQRTPALLSDALIDASPGEQKIGSGIGPRGLLSYVAESVLSRKLDASHLLEAGNLAGSVTFARRMVDVVDDPLGTQISESTSMVTLRVCIDRGADKIPSSSTSYLRLDWVDKKDLGLAFRTHDALLLIPDADPFLVCIHGLCVKSAVAALDDTMESIA